MEAFPRFTIVIPFFRVRRGHDNLFHAIDSCLRQANETFEIRVVTNLPDPQVERILWRRSDSRISLDCAGRVGVNAARNLGAQKARGDFLFFLDDDCLLPHEDFLTTLAELFRRHPDYDALGGPYASPRPAAWRTRGYNAMASAWAAAGADPSREISPAINLLGGNLCVRRELARNFPFDEEFISGADETEFLRRVSGAGHRLGFVPGLAVTHWADDSWEATFGRAWRQGRARKKANISAFRRSSPGYWRELKREPGMLPFSIIHFPALYLAEKSPNFARAIGKMRNEKKAEYDRA